LGRDSAWVVHGNTADGQPVDEVSLLGSTRICKSGGYQSIVDEEVIPQDFGLFPCEVEDLRGGDAIVNAGILTDILSGITLAAELIDSGQALERLNKLQKISKSLSA